HAAHEGHDVPAPHVVTLLLEFPGELAGPIERPLQVQLIEPTHQTQVPIRQRSGRVVHARAAQIQQFGLACHRHLGAPINHRLPLEPGNFPSALSKKSRSTVNSPIFACNSRIRSRSSAATASPPKIAVAFSNSWVFHAVTCVAWT